MPDVSVEQSRAKRLQRQKSRFRNRGGIYVPSGKNKLIDILLARSVTGESPVKKKRARKESADGRSSVRDKDKGKRKAGANSASALGGGKTDETMKAATHSDGSNSKNANSARRAPQSHSRVERRRDQDNGGQPVAGSSRFEQELVDTLNAVSKASHSHPGMAIPATANLESAPAPKRRGRPPKSQSNPPAPINQTNDRDPCIDVSTDPIPTQKPKPKRKTKAQPVSTKKRRLIVDSDDDDDEDSGYERPQAPLRKRARKAIVAPVANTLPQSKAQTKPPSRTRLETVLEESEGEDWEDDPGYHKAAKAKGKALPDPREAISKPPLGTSETQTKQPPKQPPAKVHKNRHAGEAESCREEPTARPRRAKCKPGPLYVDLDDDNEQEVDYVPAAVPPKKRARKVADSIVKPGEDAVDKPDALGSNKRHQGKRTAKDNAKLDLQPPKRNFEVDTNIPSGAELLGETTRKLDKTTLPRDAQRVKERIQIQSSKIEPDVEDDVEDEVPQRRKPGSMKGSKKTTVGGRADDDLGAESQGQNMSKAKAKAKSSAPNSKKRQREVDLTGQESSDEENGELPVQAPRKRSKLVSTPDSANADGILANKDVKTASKLTKNRSRKPAPQTNTESQKGGNTDDYPSSKPSKALLVVNENAIKTSMILSRNLKENIAVPGPTLTKGKKKGAPRPAKSKPRAKAPVRKGPPRAILERVRAALPLHPDSDSDPLDFLS